MEKKMRNVKICIVITILSFFQPLCFGADINLEIKAYMSGNLANRKVGGLALSPDEQKLYAAYWTDSSSEPIGVYSTSSYSLIDSNMSYGTCHGGVAVSNDGRYIYTPSYYQGNVSRFDTYNGNSRTALSAGEWSSGISKSPDGTKLIVYSGKDGRSYDMGNDRINVYDISNGAFSTIGSIQMPDEPRLSGAFSNDGKYIYVPTYQRQSATARLYEVSIVGTLGINRYLEFSGNSLQDVAGNDDSLFVSDSVNQKIWMIDKATWSITDSIDLSYQPGPVVLHPDGQNLFVAGNGIVSVFDITTKSLKSSLTNIPGSINNIVLTQDGSLAYISYVSGDIGGGIAIISVSEPAASTQLFFDDFTGTALDTSLWSVFVDALGEYHWPYVADGLLHSQGYHTRIDSIPAFAPMGQSVMARARIRLAGEYHKFGFAPNPNERAAPITGYYFDTVDGSVGGREHHVRALAWFQPAVGSPINLLDVEIPVTWYEFHEFAIERTPSEVIYSIDGQEVARVANAFAGALPVGVWNDRWSLMQTDWVEVSQVSEPEWSSLSGVVFDDLDHDETYDTGEEVSGAIVTCQGHSAISGNDGRCSITGLNAGETMIEASVNNILYRGLVYDLKEGDNIFDVPIYKSEIDSANACSAGASCIAGGIGLIPYAGTPSDIVSLGLGMCSIQNRFSTGDVIGGTVALLKELSTLLHLVAEWVTAGASNTVDIYVTSAKCAEGYLWEYLHDQCGGYTKCLLDTIMDSAITPLLVVFTGSPVDIQISDLQGNTLELGNNGLPLNSLPTLGWITRGPDDKELAMVFDANGTYIVEIIGRPEAGTGSTFNLQIMRQFADESRRLLTYSNVPIAASGIARVIASEEIAPLLEVDIDGDGTVDANVMPDPPIANAGPDQTVYAWIDGKAKVTLDGSDSNDPDGDELTYKWTWTIDSNTYQANGVNPIIELPVGVHTIQLVVNDGLVDSAPDDVNITVIAPLKGKLKITPCVINRDGHNCHKPDNILAFIRMPEGITKNDIDSNEPLTLYPCGSEASRQWVIPCGNGKHKQKLVGVLAFFDKDAVLDAVPDNGRVELQVVGRLNCGQYFFGSDAVKIIGRHQCDKHKW